MSQHGAIRYLYPISAASKKRNLSTTFIRSRGKKIDTRAKSTLKLPHQLLFNTLASSMSPSDGFGSIKEPPRKNVNEGKSDYKIVIKWIRPFDGSLQQYKRFKFDCDNCFRRIEKNSSSYLLNYVKSLLDETIFKFVFQTEIDTWEKLKWYLDEHFEIRLNERVLFRDLINLKRNDKERLFEYYNRIIGSRNEYKNCICTTHVDETVVKVKIEQAEEYAVDLFVSAVSMNFRPYLITKEPETIEKAYEILREIEMKSGALISHEEESLLRTCEKSKTNCRGATEENCVGENNAKSIIFCQICNRRGHSALKCRRLLDKILNSNQNQWCVPYQSANSYYNYND